MKSEHRRELHTNELSRFTEKLGKFFERHGGKVLIGILAAAAVGAGSWWFLSGSGKGLEQGTFQLVDASTPDKFQNVADLQELSGTKLASVARLRSAELLLQEAIARTFTATRAGMDDLKDAKKRFDEVLESSKLPNWARERALYGRAVCLESMWDGKSDAPMRAYKELLTEFPDTSYKAHVEQRLKALSLPHEKLFYAYFTTEERKASDIGLPKDFGTRRDGLPPNHPPITIPERPVELPRIPDTLGLDEGAAKPFPTKTGTSGAGKPGPFPSDSGKKPSGPELKPPAKSTPKGRTPAPKVEPKQE